MSDMSFKDRIAQAQSACGAVEKLSSISTDSPILPPGEYAMLLAVDVIPGKAESGPNKFNLYLTCRTIREEQGVVDGEACTINPGYLVRRYYPMQASAKQADKMSWLKDIKRLLDRTLSEGELPEDADLFTAIELFASRPRVAIVTLKIEPGSGDYGASNRPTAFKLPEPDVEQELLEEAEALDSKA